VNTGFRVCINIAGGLFVGVFFWYMLITDSPEASVDGAFYHVPKDGRGMHSNQTPDVESGLSKDSNGSDVREIKQS
jgi:hypothetical protein